MFHSANHTPECKVVFRFKFGNEKSILVNICIYFWAYEQFTYLNIFVLLHVPCGYCLNSVNSYNCAFFSCCSLILDLCFPPPSTLWTLLMTSFYKIWVNNLLIIYKHCIMSASLTRTSSWKMWIQPKVLEPKGCKNRYLTSAEWKGLGRRIWSIRWGGLNGENNVLSCFLSHLGWQARQECRSTRWIICP